MEPDCLIDSYGRRIRSLRISLTELCNFRCLYCSASVPPLVPPSEYLTKPEIVRFVRVAAGLGLEKVRLTGGEPLLRRDLPEIVRAIKNETGITEVGITTNGSRLGERLEELRDAGLDRLNISLDSLNAARFEEVTLVDAFRTVMRSIFLALEAGFAVKINTVALKGLTRHEVLEFAALARDWPLEVRFLEFMPLCGSDWKAGLFLSVAEVRSIVQEYYQLEALERGDAPAQSFRIRGGKGRIGFIGSLTESFCNQCSRIRLSADGHIRPCLFSDVQVSVRELLRTGAPDAAVAEAIREAARLKPEGNAFRRVPFDPRETAARGEGPSIRKIGG